MAPGTEAGITPPNPASSGGPEGTRTPDPHNANVMLSQLSYRPWQSEYSTTLGSGTVFRAVPTPLLFVVSLAQSPQDVPGQILPRTAAAEQSHRSAAESSDAALLASGSASGHQ